MPKSHDPQTRERQASDNPDSSLLTQVARLRDGLEAERVRRLSREGFQEFRNDLIAKLDAILRAESEVKACPECGERVGLRGFIPPGDTTHGPRCQNPIHPADAKDRPRESPHHKEEGT